MASEELARRHDEESQRRHAEQEEERVLLRLEAMDVQAGCRGTRTCLSNAVRAAIDSLAAATKTADEPEERGEGISKLELQGDDSSGELNEDEGCGADDLRVLFRSSRRWYAVMIFTCMVVAMVQLGRLVEGPRL